MCGQGLSLCVPFTRCSRCRDAVVFVRRECNPLHPNVVMFVFVSTNLLFLTSGSPCSPLFCCTAAYLFCFMLSFFSLHFRHGMYALLHDLPPGACFVVHVQQAACNQHMFPCSHVCSLSCLQCNSMPTCTSIATSAYAAKLS